LAILARLLVDITPELRSKLQASLDELDKKAKETASPIDDIFVGILKVLCGVD
jgi:hypothetical protein